MHSINANFRVVYVCIRLNNANLMRAFVPSPLIQGSLEIPVEVTVKWEDILHKKVEEVSYPLGDKDLYIDESKDILKTILNEGVRLTLTKR